MHNRRVKALKKMEKPRAVVLWVKVNMRLKNLMWQAGNLLKSLHLDKHAIQVAKNTKMEAQAI